MQLNQGFTLFIFNFRESSRGCASECKCVGHFVCVRENKYPGMYVCLACAWWSSVCVSVCQLSNYFGYLSLQLARVCTMLMVFSFLFLRDLKTPQTVLFAMIFHSLWRSHKPPVDWDVLNTEKEKLLLTFTVSVLPFIKSCLRITSTLLKKTIEPCPKHNRKCNGYNGNCIGFNGNYNGVYWYVMDSFGGMLNPIRKMPKSHYKKEFCYSFTGKKANGF